MEILSGFFSRDGKAKKDLYFNQNAHTKRHVPWICRHAVSSKGVDTTLPSLGFFSRLQRLEKESLALFTMVEEN